MKRSLHTSLFRDHESIMAFLNFVSEMRKFILYLPVFMGVILLISLHLLLLFHLFLSLKAFSMDHMLFLTPRISANHSLFIYSFSRDF